MSSKRRIRRNQCRGKARHADERAAKLAIYGTVKASPTPVGLLRAYKCPFCGSWHIGHADPMAKRW